MRSWRHGLGRKEDEAGEWKSRVRGETDRKRKGKGQSQRMNRKRIGERRGPPTRSLERNATVGDKGKRPRRRTKLERAGRLAEKGIAARG